MLSVIISLVPAFIAAVWFFGLNSLRLVGVCVTSCVLFEALVRKLMKRDLGIDDLSAVITGILLAYNLPPSLPSWMAVIGSFVAIVITKQVFGGIGYTVFNPALMGRIFLLIAFPVQMTTWSQWHILGPAQGVDSVTTASPLGFAKTTLEMGGSIPFTFDAATAWQFFIGNMNGSIGEVSALALLIGAVYLLWSADILSAWDRSTWLACQQDAGAPEPVARSWRALMDVGGKTREDQRCQDLFLRGPNGAAQMDIRRGGNGRGDRGPGRWNQLAERRNRGQGD